MDLCPHIVRRELGAGVAADLARWNVTPPRREGGQAQYIPDALGSNDFPGALAATMAWGRRIRLQRRMFRRLPDLR
ncbi:hypothetical protein ACQPXH_31910 [Nocardia sp. CA-135953]|uniref:hypothetical protein n=1 Tax=Nocardia sp. CA-135953 TaxID=3239978 RepID=UPI003D9983C8